MSGNRGDFLIRRAEHDDILRFNFLISSLGRVPLFKATFGSFNYSSIVEYSHLSLLAACGDDEESALGFVSISDSTLLESVSFDNAIFELQQYIPIEVTNTLFINFWMVEERSKTYHGDVGAEIVKKIFNSCPGLDYIVWFCPITVKQSDYLQRVFEEIEIDGSKNREENKGGDIFKDTRVLLLRRESYLHKLSVREARVEDNDDLIPILKRTHPFLMDGQEKYFLASLIQTRDESNRFYVGMIKNKLAGMLATSTDVNVSLIKKVFDIDVFSDIILKKESKARPSIQKIAIIGNIDTLEEYDIANLAGDLNCVYIDAGTSLRGSLRSFIDNTPEELGNDIKTAKQALKELNKMIKDTCNEYTQLHHKKPPVACIITGFPRTEDEAVAIFKQPGIVDVVIEVTRVLSDASELDIIRELDIEEDADTLCHMDAAEVLRNMVFAIDDAASEFRNHARWIQLPEEGDILSLLTIELAIAVERIDKTLFELDGSYNNEDQFYSNAFALTLFCTDEGSETSAIDMLRVAFEDFPNLDYCLCMVPNSSIVMPLAELMTPVKVRPGMSFNQSLYVMRKEVFLAKRKLKVVRLISIMLNTLEASIDPLGPGQNDEMNVARSAMKYSDTPLDENPTEVCFAVMFDLEMVGFIALSRSNVTNEDVNTLRANFHLDKLVDYDRHRGRSQAMITNWILSPVFSRWARYILRDIMRQYEKTLLYYQGLASTIPATEIVDELLPVSPRRSMQYNGGRLKDYTEIIEKGPLFMITKNKLSQVKTTINSRIAVVGGTSYAHAVLESFCFNPHLIFTNIFVINDRPSTPFMVGASEQFMGQRDAMFGTEFSGCLSVRDVDDPSERDMRSLGLAFKSTLVRGHLTDIDRENKSIVVSDEVRVEYDVLLIASPNQDTSVRSFPSAKSMHPSTCMERGIFGLGNPHADELALRWVMRHSLGASSTEDKERVQGPPTIGGAVVVFGSGIDVLAAIGGLIKNNVPPTLITLVIPETELEELGHVTINESVYLALHDSGVEIYPGHLVTDVLLSSHNFLQGVILENKMFRMRNQSLTGQSDESKNGESDQSSTTSGSQFVTIECASLLCCLHKSCDADVFSAINESGLVYDGGVVVDERFRTVDSSIYAIGSYTRFSRVYRDVVPHYRFNAHELGVFVGSQIIERLLNPIYEEKTQSGARIRIPPPVLSSNLPAFSLTRTVCATLPGGLTLLHSTLPDWTPNRENQPLVTGEPGTEKLSVLKLDYLGCAVEFVYVGTAPIEEQNLSCIVGLHESYLGSALFSFERGHVIHWTDFFRQAWAGTIYHDRLWDLIRDLRACVLTDKGMLTILDKVFDIAASTDDDQVVGAARKKIEGDRCTEVDKLTKIIIESKSVDFLKKNKATLLNFYLPLSAQKN